MRKLLIILIIMAGIVSCEVDSDFESEQHLVVEGWIESDGYPVVIVTKSINVTSEDRKIETLSDYLVKWATVSVSDGIDTVYLTGKYDAKFYPPFVYTTSRLKGVAGKQYKLMVDYDKFHVEATTTIPISNAVVDYRVEKCQDSDTLYKIIAVLNDDVLANNYYQFFVRTDPSMRQYYAAYLGTVADDVVESQSEIPIYRAHQLTNKDYTPYFSVNDTVSVKFTEVDEQSYYFWNDYLKSQSLANNIFMQSDENVRSNITGGLGYWCGYASKVNHFIISEYAK